MSDRAARLAEKLPEIGADLLVVTSLVNVRYLTGFTGSNGLALIGPDTRAFLTDFRYLEQSAAEVDAAFDRTIAPGAAGRAPRPAALAASCGWPSRTPT